MICHTVVRTRSPEQGAQPPITLPSLPVQTAGAEPRTPSQGTHTHSLSPVAQGHLGGLYGTDHKQKFCKLNPTFPTTHSTRFRVAPTYDWF